MERRTAKGISPVDRGEQDVSHVCRLERQRAAPTPRPQADGERDRSRDPDNSRAPTGHVVERGTPHLAVTDQTGHDHDGDHGRDRSDVHLVERVDPMDLRYPLTAPRASELSEDSAAVEGERDGR